MPDPDPLNVRETGYTDNGSGPAADTVAFSKATPAPGERRLHGDGHSIDSQSLPPKHTASTGNMPSISVTGTGGHPEPVEASPVKLIVGAAVLMALLVLAGAAAVITLSADSSGDEAPKTDDIDEVMGVPVEKGFKKPQGG